MTLRRVKAQLGENGKREVLLQPTRPSFDGDQLFLSHTGKLDVVGGL